MRRRIVANAAEFFDIAQTADEQMSEKITLTEGEDYGFEEAAPVLTEAGFRKMGQAHADGLDVVIEFDEIVIFRFRAKF